MSEFMDKPKAMLQTIDDVREALKQPKKRSFRPERIGYLQNQKPLADRPDR